MTTLLVLQLGAVGHLLVRLVAPQGQQQRGRRQLAPPIDAHIDKILGVELEIEPRPAIGDDPGGIEILARGMGLALVMVEENARRTVHLADDDALGAVDDEGAVGRHQGHVAHIDVLLLDVADGAGAAILVDVPDDQAQGHLERRAEAHAPLLAFLDVILRVLQLVFDELKFGPLREVADRKNRLEHFLQADIRAVFRRHADLQEMVVRALLHFDQIGHPADFRNTPEVSANALATGKRLAHRCPRLKRLWGQ